MTYFAPILVTWSFLFINRPYLVLNYADFDPIGNMDRRNP